MRKVIIWTVILLLTGASISPKHFGLLGEVIEPVSISKAVDITICKMPTTSAEWCDEAGVSK